MDNTLFCSQCTWHSTLWLAREIAATTPPDEILSAFIRLLADGSPTSGKGTFPSSLTLVKGIP
jgi:hypothetical protein